MGPHPACLFFSGGMLVNLFLLSKTVQREMISDTLGSENRQWGTVAPLGSRPWRVRSGPEIHQKISNFKTFPNIYSFRPDRPRQGLQISPVNTNFLYFPVYSNTSICNWYTLIYRVLIVDLHHLIPCKAYRLSTNC